MKLPSKRLFFVAIGAMLLIACNSTFASDWGRFIGGLGKGAADAADQHIQLEQEKELIRYRHELEMERLRQQQEQERLQKVTAEKARRKAEEEEKRNAISTGTGFFVTPDGHLVTNAHVVGDKSYVAIRDHKGKFYRATVLAKNTQLDLALLKVNGHFPSLYIGHSDQATKGQRVLAVGYPQISIQGNESKVTDGIISSFSGLQNNDDWFQISVPIQGGNSGGPLVTEGGTVIGVVVATVNIQKFHSITGSMPQNVNFAIKSRLLLNFLSKERVRNTPSSQRKISIDAVDQATVLVVAKNDPIEVRFVEPDKRETARDGASTKPKEITAKPVEKALPLPTQQSVKRLVEIGRVTSVFQQYGYIIFALNDQGYANIGNVVLVSDGSHINGAAEKRLGANVSVIINESGLKRIKIGDVVLVYQ